MRSLQQAALDLAECGFALFPVAADCRSPLIKRGVHAASADPATVAEMFSRPANIAIACGPISGVFVLDIDVKGGVDGFASAQLLGLSPSWRARTPSGGEHWYFRHPAHRPLRNRVGFRSGLDIRAAGGSVAAPPSAKVTGEYCWIVAPWEAELGDAPPELLELIDPPLPPPRPIPPAPRRGYGVAALTREAAEVAATKVGRNQRLFVAAANLGALVGAGLLGEDAMRAALEDAALRCGLTREDGLRSVRATIESGLRRGLANPRRASDLTPEMRRWLAERRRAA